MSVLYVKNLSPNLVALKKHRKAHTEEDSTAAAFAPTIAYAAPQDQARD